MSEELDNPIEVEEAIAEQIELAYAQKLPGPDHVSGSFIHINQYESDEMWQVEFVVSGGDGTNIHFGWTISDAATASAVESIWRDQDIANWQERLSLVVEVLCEGL